MSDQSSSNLLQQLQDHFPESERPLLEKAYQFVHEKSSSASMNFALSPENMGLHIAEVLLNLNCDPHTIIAGILYPLTHTTEITSETITQSFNISIYKLINGARKMESAHAITTLLQNSAQQKQQIDNLRKMLLAMVDDIRIVLLKLAEQLVILKFLKYYSSDQQIKIAKQIMEIYAPLANRLGVGQIKWQLEDLSFRYIDPHSYQEISKALNMRRTDRESFIQEMNAKLTQLFKDSTTETISIMGRAKHIYSIYRKMQKKHVEFNEIYDTSAFRILVPSIKECYLALGIIHSTWPHIPKEFDDYIAKPKPNGYRSIHTAVIGPHSIQVEIQIRTHEMHEQSELGIAAHWKYKEGNNAEAQYENKINWLREVMDWQKEVTSEQSGDENLYSKIFRDRVYIFSPLGEVFDLPATATPLDFAYLIHSNLGHRCRGAKVNGALVPLTYQLKTGDQVQIITVKEGQPSRDWMNPHLGYVNTSQARNKIRHWFKKLNYQKNLEEGLALWEKNAKREGIAKSKLNKVAAHFNFKSGEDLLASLGAGDIHLAHILNQIKSETDSTEKDESAKENTLFEAPFKTSKIDSHFIIEGETNLLTQLARCCKPIPGDAIIGYITKGRGITIHQQKCKNVAEIQKLKSERLINVYWDQQSSKIFPVDIVVESQDRSGLIRDITNLIVNEDISLIGLTTRINQLESKARIHFTIEISSLQLLNKLLIQLNQMPGVIRASRA